MTDGTTLTVYGEGELAARAGRLFDGATREFFCAAADLHTWSRPEARSGFVSRLRSGPTGRLAVRKLYTPAVLADEEQRLHLFDVAAAGGQVRLRAATLPHEAIVIDRRVMILAGRRGPRGREFTITTSSTLVGSVHALMRATWDAGVPLADCLRRETDGLDADSLAVLRALAAGLTDSVGARRVGMSLRTYRRRVAEVLSVLDADSRFQAGVHAGRLGLTGGST
ncbi:DNA-binding response regulator [Streptomyces sp. NPDC014734]|uniref:helix-turn-helix transcriptional regulator n=1 Tax=Streptomyces sp. NPDC014734 TaxID=3364886 RepID=UPI0036FD82F0